MTYTEHDLRNALAADEVETSDPGRLLHEVNRRAATRRRWRAAGTAGGVGVFVAAAAAVVVISPSLMASGGGGAAPGAAPATGAAPGAAATTASSAGTATKEPTRPTRRPPFAFTVGGSAGGVQVIPMAVDADRQTATVRIPDDRNKLWLEVYEPGRFDPTAWTGGAPVDINGRKGFYTAKRVDAGPRSDASVTLVWEYAPGAWAVLGGDVIGRDDRNVAVRAARAVTFGKPTEARVPFAMVRAPSGLRTLRVESDADTASVQFASATAATDVTLTIRAYPPALDDKTWQPNGQAAGRPAMWAEPSTPGGPASPKVVVDFGVLRLALVGEGDDDRNALERIIRGLTVATTLDHEQWWPASDALPVG
jgi:hypothetical protein